MKNITLLIALFLMSCSAPVVRPVVREVSKPRPPEPTVETREDKPPSVVDTPVNIVAVPEVPESIDVALIDFESIYTKAPALQRLRASIDSYKPAQEYAALATDTSPEAEARKKVLRNLVKSKMTGIIYDCKNLIHEAINKEYGSTFKIIYNVHGGILVAEELVNGMPDGAPIRQTDITGKVISLLQ